MNDDDIIAIIRQYLADYARDNGLSPAPSQAGWWDVPLAPVQTAMPPLGGQSPASHPQYWEDGTMSNPFGNGPSVEELLALHSQEQTAKEMRPFWEPFRGYSEIAQMLHPPSAPLMRQDFTPPGLGVGTVKVKQAQESRKDTSKRRPVPASDARNQVEHTYIEPRNPVVYQPSPVVRTLVAAPAGSAAARNLFR